MELFKGKVDCKKSDEEENVVLQVAELKYYTSDAKNFLAVDLTQAIVLHLINKNSILLA